MADQEKGQIITQSAAGKQVAKKEPVSAADLAAKLAAGLRARGLGEKIEKPPYQGICTKGPDCPECHGLGYVRYDYPLGHPKFGRLEYCPHVDVWRIKGAEFYGINSKDMDFLRWDAIQAIEGQDAWRAAQAVRGVLQRGYGWVYLYGSHGQAKSLILQVAVAESLKANKMAAYANMVEVIHHIRMAFDERNPNQEAHERLEWWANLPILALDEFDRFNKTSFAEASQFQLMDKRNRQALREEGVTLIASNQAPEELDGYYQSRINDGRFTVIPLYGTDGRRMMTRGQKI